MGVNPPRVRPSAVGGLAGGPVFHRARSDAMRPDVAAVDAPQLPVDPARLDQLARGGARMWPHSPSRLHRPPALARSEATVDHGP